MAGTYSITELPALIFSPRIELGTSRVLGERHNQLDHENAGVSGFRSQYLVLAKHARFRLRQYPIKIPTALAENRTVRAVLVRRDRTGCSSRLAQLVERKTLNLVVVGSSPTVGDFFRRFDDEFTRARYTTQIL